jgi:hypothetical protein
MKVIIHKTLRRPVLVYGAEAWFLTKQDKMYLGCVERKMLLKIYGPSYSQEIGEEEPILNFITYIMMMT